MRDQFIFQDDSGGIVVKMDVRGDPFTVPGRELAIRGYCQVDYGEIISDAVINNDGLHSVSEQSTDIFLPSGDYPLTVEWFNGPLDFQLELDCEGPGMSREPIPSSMLFRTQAGRAFNGPPTQGLNYSCFEGGWSFLPDFSQLRPIKTGTVHNLDLRVRSRDTNVAIVFWGGIKIRVGGEYKFWLKSDDGSKLYLGSRNLRLEDLGYSEWPQPRHLFPGQTSFDQQDCQWSTVDGEVVRVWDAYGAIVVGLAFGDGELYLKVVNGDYRTLSLLEHCRIRATGIFQNSCTPDGQAAIALLVQNMDRIEVLEMPSWYWTDYPTISIHDLIFSNRLESLSRIVHINGVIHSNLSSKYSMIDDGTGRLLLELHGNLPRNGDKIEVLGFWRSTEGTPTLQNSIYRSDLGGDIRNRPQLPLLTEAVEVKELSRTEARRGYPVKIRGVVTARADSNFVLQDSTWSVFCYWNGLGPENSPQIGDYWEIKGRSDVGFAPDVIVQDAKYLCPGILPQPIQPSKDEMMNGSLDTQYIEIQGIVTSIYTNAVTLLTRDGKVNIHLYDPKPPTLSGLEGALIQICGVCIPNRDTNGMITTEMSPLGFFDASININKPAPSDPFEIPLKRTSDLFIFDPRADALRRVKVAGQILGERQDEYFMTDGANGLRFEPKNVVKIPIGSLVEVVGFPDMTGPSPILREALVRVTGRGDLPKAKELSEATVFDDGLDSTLVQVESRLLGSSVNQNEQILGLQIGNRNYIARLDESLGTIQGVLPGCLLELTGVYMGQGGNPTSRQTVNSFELLLSSPSDVRVLARPSWWTLRHTFFVTGSMMLVIIIGIAWIGTLRRQVEERSLELAAEVKSREQAEHQRALEAERSRIAQDLHDDLGATLTEIRFLSAIKGRDLLVPEETRLQLSEVSEKSRQMVSLLDEIVWAVNPANDFLPNVANYLCNLAEEFFRSTEIRCRLDVDDTLPPIPLTSEVRHNLCLVIREALNNVGKHSRAKEAWLKIHWLNQTLQIVIQDDGRGFSVNQTGFSGNGLFNMRHRMEKIIGHFECVSRPGIGTTCSIRLPLIWSKL